MTSIKELLQKIADCDENAMEELVRLTYKKLFSAAFSIVPDKHLAEDAVQNTYITVMEKAHSFNPLRGGGISWLISITRKNMAYIYRSTKASRECPINEEIVYSWSPEDFLNTDIIDLLTSDEQQAIIRKAMGFKYSDISVQTDWSIDKITNLVRDAKKKIKKYLTDLENI